MAEEKAETEDATESNDSPVMAKPIILGRKLGMLQMFKEDGSAVAATVIATEQIGVYGKPIVHGSSTD